MTYLLNQITMPSSGPKFVNVFDDGGNQVLSVDVSTSTAVIYSGDTLTITTSTSFFTSRMYYLLADSGMCVCVCVWIFVTMSVCVCSCEQISGQACIRGYLHACLCVRASLCMCVSAYKSPLLHPFVYLRYMCVCVCMCVCMCL